MKKASEEEAVLIGLREKWGRVQPALDGPKRETKHGA